MLPIFALLIPILVLGIAFVTLYGQPMDGRLQWLTERRGQIWTAGVVFVITASRIVFLVN